MNCQKFDEEALTSSLQSLAEEMASLNAPPEVEQKLRQAFRARKVVVPVWRRRARYWVAAGIAAVLLIAISVIAFRWRADQRPQMNAETTKPQQVKEEPRVDPAPPSKQDEQVAQKPRRRSVHRTPR